MDLEGNILQGILEEVEAVDEREHIRVSHKHLRDTSDPFSLPEKNFVGIFRVSRDLARDLITEMSDYYPAQERTSGIPIFIRVLAALQILGQGSYQKCVAQNFNLGLSQPSMSRCLSAFCNVLVTHFSNVWIKFPTQEADKMTIKAGFMRQFNFPGIVGCIDCTHIAIHPPPAEHVEHPAIAFYNRKGFYSLNTQIICDFNLQILAVNARYPGSVHDSAIWRMSNVRDHLEQQHNMGDQSSWLLGDSGYPLEPWLMTPIANAAPNTPEYRYTRAHCSARNTVERTIGVLKSVFRCLSKDRTLHYTPRKAAEIIYSCCILHNMRLHRRMLQINAEELPPVEEDVNAGINNNEAELVAAKRIRSNIVRNHFI